MFYNELSWEDRRTLLVLHFSCVGFGERRRSLLGVCSSRRGRTPLMNTMETICRVESIDEHFISRSPTSIHSFVWLHCLSGLTGTVHRKNGKSSSRIECWELTADGARFRRHAIFRKAILRGSNIGDTFEKNSLTQLGRLR